MFRVASFVFILVVSHCSNVAAVQLFAEGEMFRMNAPDEIWQDSAADDAIGEEVLLSAVFEQRPLPIPPALQSDFATGTGSTGAVPRSRARSSGPPGVDRAPFKTRVHWIPAKSIAGQTGKLAVSGEEFELGYPVRIDDDGIWLAQGSVQRLDLNTPVFLPESGLPVPNQLWDIEVGLMHIRDLGEDWQAGGMLRVGSPSDQPFAAWRDMTVTFLGFLTIPTRERDAWSFSLFYSPTGQIIFPIPGVAYVWRPNDQFEANLGIPFSLAYKPTETLVLTANYMPLNNVQVLLRQSLGDTWSLYGGYRTVSETFLLAHRENDRERTYLFDQRFLLGAQCELGRGWTLDLSTAYVFDRQLFQAEKFSGSRRDELLIDPGMAASLQLIWTR